MATDTQRFQASRDAIESARQVYSSIQTTFPLAVTNFESKWAAWHEYCQAQTAKPSLDIYAQGEEFDILAKLGPKIVPLVVHKLATNDDQPPYGVLLYNAVENDAAYRASSDEPRDTEALQSYSKEIVERNYQSNQILQERLKLWAAHCSQYPHTSSVELYCMCDEYDDLVEMGPSVIAQLMVEWVNDRGGYWYELLHEIAHGRKMGAHSVNRRATFAESVEWFDEGNHDQAPKYIPTEFDEYIYTGKIGPQVWEHLKRAGQ